MKNAGCCSFGADGDGSTDAWVCLLCYCSCSVRIAVAFCGMDSIKVIKPTVKDSGIAAGALLREDVRSQCIVVLKSELRFQRDTRKAKKVNCSFKRISLFFLEWFHQFDCSIAVSQPVPKLNRGPDWRTHLPVRCTLIPFE